MRCTFEFMLPCRLCAVAWFRKRFAVLCVLVSGRSVELALYRELIYMSFPPLSIAGDSAAVVAIDWKDAHSFFGVGTASSGLTTSS